VERDFAKYLRLPQGGVAAVLITQPDVPEHAGEQG
jgi:hypothetical protein